MNEQPQPCPACRAEQAEASRDHLGKALDYLVHFNTEDALTNAKAALLECWVPHHIIQGWRPEMEDEA